MNIDEMNKFNDKVEDLDIVNVKPHKFNGCGFVLIHSTNLCLENLLNRFVKVANF